MEDVLIWMIVMDFAKLGYLRLAEHRAAQPSLSQQLLSLAVPSSP